MKIILRDLTGSSLELGIRGQLPTGRQTNRRWIKANRFGARPIGAGFLVASVGSRLGRRHDQGAGVEGKGPNAVARRKRSECESEHRSVCDGNT